MKLENYLVTEVKLVKVVTEFIITAGSEEEAIMNLFDSPDTYKAVSQMEEQLDESEIFAELISVEN